MKLNKKVENILRDLKDGKMIGLSDSREHECDLVALGSKITPSMLTFMSKKASGILCISMEENRANELGIPRVPSNGRDALLTPFYASCDSVHNSTTGVSSFDRWETIQVMINKKSTNSDLSIFGHFNILAVDIKSDRPGHTNNSIRLSKLCGEDPCVAVIVEVLLSDGKMLHSDNAPEWCKKNKIKHITIDEVVQYIQDNKIIF